MPVDAPEKLPEKKKTKRLKQFKLVRQVADQVDKHIEFLNRVPICCLEQCSRFDGKRCRLTGNEPEQTCQPVVSKLVKLACSLDLVLFEEKGPNS